MALYNSFNRFGTKFDNEFPRLSPITTSAQAPTSSGARSTDMTTPQAEPTRTAQPSGSSVDKSNLNATAIDAISSLAAGAIGGAVASKSQKEREETESQLAAMEEEKFQSQLGQLKRGADIAGQDYTSALRQRIGAGANIMRPGSNLSKMSINPNMGTQRFGGAR